MLEVKVDKRDRIVCPECKEPGVYVRVEVGTILAEPFVIENDLTFVASHESIVDCPIVGLECAECGYLFNGDVTVKGGRP